MTIRTLEKQSTYMKKLFLFLIVVSIFACNEEEGDQPKVSEDNFDRQAMLVNWADNIIVPAYTSFAEKTTALKLASEAFSTNPNTSNYESLVNNWETAYIEFQKVSMFEIGKAEELRLTNNLNIYPSNTDGIIDNIMNGGYNLELPSQIAMQGFPALDYLLFGVSDTDDVLNFYQNNEDADKYLDYLNVLTTRINELATVVLDDWNNRFRDKFVQNSGNSALASVDKVVNDFIFYYEKHLRAGKIGIPAGVFSGTTLPENVEAFYNKNFSKTLFNASLDAVQDFFNGVHFDGGNEGESMSNYLEYLDVIKNDKNLAQVINDQFDSARLTAQELSDNFAEQVETDNVKMLATYDQLQLNVVHIKVDMLQAFNVNVDYVDADGD